MTDVTKTVRRYYQASREHGFGKCIIRVNIETLENGWERTGDPQIVAVSADIDQEWEILSQPQACPIDMIRGLQELPPEAAAAWALQER